MQENDLQLLLRAAQAAAETATTYIGGALDIRDKPGGEGPVTLADLAVNSVLEDVLRSARPDYGWLSEESTDDPARLAADAVFVVDPIDGTRSFIDGQSTWAHSLAVVRGGVVEAAVIELPMLGKTYAAARGGGATLNGAAIRVSGAKRLPDAEVLATKPTLDPRHWPGGVPTFRRSHRPSLAYRLGLVAEGRFDAMLTLRPSWEWDIAAGTLVLEESGALATDRTGAPLRFNNDHPKTDGVVGAGPMLHAALLRALGQTPAATA